MKITRHISRSISRSTVSIALLLALMLSIAPPAHAAGDTDTWARIDTSNASQGVISVSIDPVPSGYAVVSLFWKEDGKWTGARWAIDDNNQTVSIPLMGDEDAYQVKIQQPGNNTELKASFTGAPNADPYLASCPRVDYDNAPETKAMAQSLTQGCTTDAQKIKAVFNYVSSTLTYDTKAADELIARQKSGASKSELRYERDLTLGLDGILAAKTGVCEHYAVLAAGMLRSLGIECKVVTGKANTGSSWGSHAWISVSPDITGLNKTALGTGTDADGWTRLDPTWGRTETGRKLTCNDSAYKAISCY